MLFRSPLYVAARGSTDYVLYAVGIVVMHALSQDIWFIGIVERHWELLDVASWFYHVIPYDAHLHKDRR